MTRFKIKTAAVLLFCLAVLGISVSAASREYDIILDDGFTVGYADGNLDGVSGIIGKPSDELRSYCESNGVLFIAVNPDNSIQIRLSAFKSEFSVKAGDIRALDSEGLSLFAESLSSGADYTVLETENTAFLKFTAVLSDSGGDYVSTQYVTLSGGKVYQLSCYNSGNAEAPCVTAAAESFSVVTDTASDLRQKLLFAAVLLALAGVITVMVIGIIKDIK